MPLFGVLTPVVVRRAENTWWRTCAFSMLSMHEKEEEEENTESTWSSSANQSSRSELSP